MQDQRGEFVDVKINSAELIKNIAKYQGKSIVIWSVTDPYQAIEEKYQLTRNILKKLIGLDTHIDIITKSKLITRDIDILKQLKNVMVTTSFCANDESTKKLFEPNSPTLEERKNSLKTLHENGIVTTLFISPLLPEVTDWENIILETKKYVNEYRFENLNLYSSIKKDIYEIVGTIDPSLLTTYKTIYEGWQYEEYRDHVESDIQQFCKNLWVAYKMYFHHKENKK